MRRILILLVPVMSLPALAVAGLAPAAGALATSQSGSSVAANAAKGTYSFTFVPNNGSPGDTYPWTLKGHHKMNGDDYFFGTWKYHGDDLTVKYTSTGESPDTPICTFDGTGTPTAGFSGSYVCPTGASGTWSTSPKE